MAYPTSEEKVITLGFDTILTSGQAPVADGGIQLLKELYKQADGRIQVMAGGGVKPDNLCLLIKETGIRIYHMSGKRDADSRMQYRKEGMSFGLPERNEYVLTETDEEVIRKAVEILHEA